MLNNFNCINQARPCLNEDYYTIMSKFLMNKDIRYIEKPLTALAEMGHKDALIAYLLNFKNMNSSTISPKVKEQLSEISYRDGFEAALVKLAEVYCEDYKTIQILQNGMIGMYRNVKNKAFKSQDIHLKAYQEYKQNYLNHKYVKLAAYIVRFYGTDVIYKFAKFYNNVKMQKYIDMLKAVDCVPDEILFEDTLKIKKVNKKIRSNLNTLYTCSSENAFTLAENIMKNYNSLDVDSQSFCYDVLYQFAKRPLSNELKNYINNSAEK